MDAVAVLSELMAKATFEHCCAALSKSEVAGVGRSKGGGGGGEVRVEHVDMLM